MEETQKKWTFPVWMAPVGVAALALCIAGGAWIYVRSPEPGVNTRTPYQAVLLTNNQVYFGRLEGYGATPHPILREVYYVKSAVDPKTNAATNILVKRGQEWHAPDHMILSADQVVLVEPVTRGSKVMELITALRMQR